MSRAFSRHGQAMKKVSVAISTPLTTFSYGDVKLFDGPMKRQFEENHARFQNLDDDRMLKVYRQVAGLPAPGEDMGGWYDLTGFSLEGGEFHGFIAGHSFGQYVSGTGPGVCRDRIRANAGQDQSSGERVRRDTGCEGKILR